MKKYISFGGGVKSVREYAIEIIQNTHPADNQYNPTTGQELLAQAKRKINGWQTEPTEVLIKYAQLCIEKERNITANKQTLQTKGD